MNRQHIEREDSRETSIRIRVFDYQGNLISLLATEVQLPKTLFWTRSLNKVDNMKFSVPLGHEVLSSIDVGQYVVMDRRIPSLLPDWTHAWGGSVVGMEKRYDDKRQDVEIISRSWEWILSGRAVWWNSGTEGKSLWTGVELSTIAKNLIEYNVGRLAVQSGGRWQDGLITWPVIQYEMSGGKNHNYAVRDQDVLRAIMELVKMEDMVFDVKWKDPGIITAKMKVRPLGVERSVSSEDFRFLSPRWNTIETAREKFNISKTSTHVAVRDQSEDNPSTFENLVLEPGNPRRESIVHKSDSNISSEDVGRQWLDQHVAKSRTVSIEPNLQRMVFGRDFDLGDRLRVEVFESDEILVGEVSSVSVKYTNGIGERIGVGVQVAYAGVYGS